MLNNKTISRMLYALTVFMLVCQFLIVDFRLPDGIMVVVDIATVLCLLYLIPNFRTEVSRTQTMLPLAVTALLLLDTLVGLIFSSKSISQYFTGLRLYGRYFVFFFTAAFVLNRQRVRKLLDLMKTFVWLNAAACTVEYFVFGYRGDTCCGLFGTANMNSWMNILLCIVASYAVASYLNAGYKLKDFLLICVPCLYISVLAEIKFFYFELAIIVILMIIFTRPSRKTIAIGIAGIVMLLILSQVVDATWSSSSSAVFTREGLEDYFSKKSYGYSNVGDIGRIGGISRLNELFFPDEVNLFGKGIGSCNYGTAFYIRYSHLHYIWFGYLTIYLEMGWAGLILYVAFFASTFLGIDQFQRRKISVNPWDVTIFMVGKSMAVLGVILIWYNTTIKNYPAFFLFLSLSFAFAVRKDLMAEKRLYENG